MRKRKQPSPDDGRPPRNMALSLAPSAASALSLAPSPSSAATPSAASALSLAPSASSSSDISVTFGGPHAGPSWLARRRGSSTGARPLQGTERLEHGGYGARVVFGAQLIEYENGLDYAARLSKPAYFHGYTAIPLGNAPWSDCRRWAKGVLKGAREGGRDRGPRKGGERQGAREDAQALGTQEHKPKESRL